MALCVVYNVTVDSDVLVGLSASVFGGALVSFVTYVSNRGRIMAETTKLLAEAERTKAETAALLAPQSQSASNHAKSIPLWEVRGSRPEDYDVEIDRTVAHTGSSSARLTARPGARGFVTLMQKVGAKAMRGQRVRMSAYVKCEDLDYGALWMRVDGPENEMIGFDNMFDRPIEGTADWRKYDIVLDIPETSIFVAFGVLLCVRGRLWADDFAFEQVNDDVPVTDVVGDDPVLPTPDNLGFED